MLKVIRNHARVAGYLKDSFEGLNYTPMKVDHDLLNKMELKYISTCLKTSGNLPMILEKNMVIEMLKYQ